MQEILNLIDFEMSKLVIKLRHTNSELKQAIWAQKKHAKVKSDTTQAMKEYEKIRSIVRQDMGLKDEEDSGHITDTGTDSNADANPNVRFETT